MHKYTEGCLAFSCSSSFQICISFSIKCYSQQAKSQEDGEMGLQFMQEMLELTKMQSMNQLAQLQVRNFEENWALNRLMVRYDKEVQFNLRRMFFNYGSKCCNINKYLKQYVHFNISNVS